MMKLSKSRVLVSFAFLVGSALLIGCDSGPKRYGVSGNVTYKGEPVVSGTIDFRGDDGTTSGGQITNGKYEISKESGLTVGKYKVAITYPDPKAPKPKLDPLPGEPTRQKDILPAKYNDNTELTAEIKAEAMNTVNFDLK